MRVCVLTHTYPRFPGDINAPFVEHLMERIAARGVEVAILTAFDPAWDRRPADHTVDLRTYRYVIPDRLHILGYSRTIEGNIRFRKRVLALSPLLFIGGLRAFGGLVREKRPDVLHAHWLLPNGWIASRISRTAGIPLLIQLHGSDVFTAEKNALFRHLARAAMAAAACVTTPSPDHIQRLAAIGCDVSRMRVVPNAVEAGFCECVTDTDVTALRTRLGIGAGRPVVLALGRLVHVKGFDYLLEAFARIAAADPAPVLVLAGGGVLERDLSGLAESLGIADRVIMPGAVMRDDIPVYFRMAAVFVAPSIRHESGAVDGLPVVVPEAMAAGVPVVASRIGGIPVLVRDGWNGVLVPERDPAAIADAVQRLLADPCLREACGARGRDLIQRRVNHDTIADHYMTLYRALIERLPDLPEFDLPHG